MKPLATLLFAGLVALAACGRDTASRSEILPGPILIISVDTLRADHLPAYGGTGVETPHLDALARDSIVFENAYSQVPLTLPSHASMLTGKLPAEIGVRNNLGYRFDPAIASIPGVFRERGWETGAAVSAYVLRSETGLGEAFGFYDDAVEGEAGAIVGEIQRSGESTVDAALEWVRGRASGRFFFLLHLFEPHAPYEPPEPFRTKYASSPYDGEIAAADAAVGRFLDVIRERGWYDDATIVFLSDHGEGLGDHGEQQHGIFLYREAIRVPLFLKLPSSRRGGTRVDAAVGLTDVFPTLLEGAGVEFDRSGTAGASLLAAADGSLPDRRIFSETMYPRIHLGWSDLASLVDGSFHYIAAPRSELYDLRSDPGERTNVLADQRRIHAAMKREMEGYDRALHAPVAVDPEEAAKLAALGYLGGTAPPTAGELPDPKDRIGDLESFTRAAALVEEGSPADAAAVLEGVVERNRAFADAWTLLGKAYDESGRTEDAIEAWRTTIEVAPMLAPGTALSIAEAQLRLQRFDEAIEHAELASSAHAAESRLVRAKALFGKRDFAAAAREAGALMSDPRMRLEATVLAAQIHSVERRFEQALAMLQSADEERIRANQPPIANLSLARGDALARIGRIEEAKEAFRRETREFPRNREAWIRLAALHVLGGDLATAEQVMRALARENPGQSTSAMIAGAYRSLGRSELARRWETEAR